MLTHDQAKHLHFYIPTSGLEADKMVDALNRLDQTDALVEQILGDRTKLEHHANRGHVLELFSSRISVDQDLSVIVAEINNDDDVKQRLLQIVFHASVTQQRSSGSKTRISCSHAHERTNSCPPLQTSVREKGSHTN